MRINVTDSYISIETKNKDERFSTSHIRKVNKYKIKRKIEREEYRIWKDQPKEIFKFGAYVLLFWLVLIIFNEINTQSNIILMASLSLFMYAGYKKIFLEPRQYHYYQVHFMEFISGENEIYGISSLSKEPIEEFASVVSNAMKGDFSGVYNINIDKSINSETTSIDSLYNDGKGAINFYEGSESKKLLTASNEMDDE